MSGRDPRFGLRPGGQVIDQPLHADVDLLLPAQATSPRLLSLALPTPTLSPVHEDEPYF